MDRFTKASLSANCSGFSKLAFFKEKCASQEKFQFSLPKLLYKGFHNTQRSVCFLGESKFIFSSTRLL